MMRPDSRLTFALLAGTMLSAPAANAVELPHGASVTYGQVGIASPSANALAIRQSTNTAIVNWQGFSIGQGGRVDVTQPSSSSALLNRVTGSAPSTIAGQLNANGQVYLVNPNGIAITRTGTVNAGGFVASTLNTTDEDFVAGRRNFSGRGASAPVTNQGRITIQPGGYAALLGGSVDQAGVISVPMGKVGLGAGERATLDFSGDGFLQVAVPSAPNGSDTPLIRHSGRTSASGGRVEIQAATARDAARQAINLSGIVEARSVGGRSGAIVLGGGAGGAVTVTGRLDTSARSRTRHAQGAGRSKTANGGSITVTGDRVRLAGARIAANGAKGGTVRIGGDAHGAGGLQRASTTSVDAATTIHADSTGTGDGGSVVLWSDARTDFAGTIFARGGSRGGDGGFSEVSSKGLLNYTGLADLSAARGHFGTLLLDPFNVSITTGADAGAPNAGGTFTAGANDSVINNTTLQTALNAANVTVTTGGAGSPGAQAGDIAVLANVAWTAPTTLTLSAFRDVDIGRGGATAAGGQAATITPPATGRVVLRADNSGTGIGAVNFATETLATVGTGNVGIVDVTSGGQVDIYYNPANNPAGSGVNPTSYTAPTSFLGGGFTIGGVYGTPTNPAGAVGTGTLTAAMLVNTVADLQDMRNNLAGNYALGRSIDATGAAAFNGGAGFAPVGDTTAAYTGNFNGLGQTISNLTINNAASGNGTGLFGASTLATLSNVTLANVNVSGGNNTGGVVGSAAGGTITGVAVGGTVIGADTTGGLVGGMNGTAISASSSTAAVAGTDNIGGLIGVVEGGSVSTSSATGSANGGNDVGGLIGLAQDTTLTQLYATGSVTSTGTYAGGLIGALGGDGPAPAATTLSQSYANGSVNGPGGTGPTYAGGLIGLVSNDTTISDSYATGLVNGSTAAGGLIGQLNTTPVAGAVAPASNPSTITNTYATGLVTGAGTRGGLIGEITDVNQTVATSYFDTQTTGQTTTAGGLGTGQTTAQLQGALPTGFTPTVWGRQAANTYPYLNWRYPTGILATSGFVRDTAGAVIAGEPVREAAGAAVSYQGNSGANGYYYFAREPLSGVQPQGATVYLDGTNRGSSTSDAPIGAGNIPNLDVQVGRALVRTNQTTTSGLAAVLASAGDSAVSANIPYAVGTAAGTPTFAPSVALFVEAANAAGLTVDRSLVANGAAQIAGLGSAIPAGPVTIAAGNTVQSTGGNVVIATSQFTNNAGVNGIQATGRYLVYSNDYAADTRGGLAGGNLYNRSFTSSPVATIPGTASTFIYVRQPTLTFGAADSTRQYGTAPPAPTGTVTGFVNGDTAGVTYTGAPTITDTTSTATAVGTYPGSIQVGAGSLLSTIGYAFAFTNAAVSVTPAPLTIAANNAAKTYGDTFAFAGTEFTATGLRNADTVTSTTLASAGAPATASVAGSPYAITASNAAGTGIGNYTITYVPGALTVNPAALTVQANNAAKTYGDAFAFAGTEFTATGLRNADTVTSTTLTSAGAPATATVAGSPYAITASNAAGTGLGNYTIAYAPGALTVNPAALTVTANDATKAYGTTLTFAGTEFTTSGLRNADTVTSTTLTSAGAPATASVAGSPYPIAVSNAVGTGLGNYAISYVPGALTVTPVALSLTVTANNATKTYGNTLTFAGTEFTTAGLQNSDTVTSATLTSAGAAATAPVAASPYPIFVSNAQGTGLGNYAITYVPGALTVAPAPLTIAANNAAKTYGDTFGFAGTEFTATGLRNADTVTSTTLASAGAPATATVAGTPYAITASNAVGTGLGNYTIAYAPGALTVNPAALTVTANDASKVSGTTLTFAGTEFTATGLRNGDQVVSTTLASAGAPADAAAAGSPYPIVASNAQGRGLGNYTIGYLPGALTITPAPIRTSPFGLLALAELSPTLDRQLPGFTSVYDAPDIIEVATGGDGGLGVGGGGGPTLGTRAGGQIIANATDTLSFVEGASTDLEANVASCERRDDKRLKPYTDCVGNALDRYADRLESRSLLLPAPLRNVTATIREAARRVRTARTITEARTAVRTAVAAVRKAIALIRADDPALARIQVNQGNRIASALQSVDTRLARAVGL